MSFMVFLFVSHFARSPTPNPDIYFEPVLMPSPLFARRPSKQRQSQSAHPLMLGKPKNGCCASDGSSQKLAKKASLSPPSQIYKCFGTSKRNPTATKKTGEMKKVDALDPQRHDPLLIAALLRRRFSRYLRGERKRSSACVRAGCLEFEDFQVGSLCLNLPLPTYNSASSTHFLNGLGVLLYSVIYCKCM